MYYITEVIDPWIFSDFLGLPVIKNRFAMWESDFLSFFLHLMMEVDIYRLWKIVTNKEGKNLGNWVKNILSFLRDKLKLLELCIFCGKKETQKEC